MERSNFGLTTARFMPHSPAALFALLASAAAVAAPAPSPDGQMAFRGQIVIRVPGVPSAAAAPLVGNNAGRPVRLIERKGPKCIAVSQLGGAAVNGRDLDIVLKGGAQVRAKLDGDCAAFSNYGNFYLKPSADGQICAGRDSIRTRSGDSCGIKRFHKLVVKR
jgi:hypothetical protein